MKFIISIFAFIIFGLFSSSVFAQNIYTTEKLITVDTGKQMLYAWDGGQIVYQTAVSTGLWQTPTVKGTFRIYRKLPVQDMKGYSKVKGWYYLPNVPNVMYFYSGYAIHGAYWHNVFGSRASNGCVNVPPASAQWLYDWAPHGTRVVVF
ncbi:MAG TPA: L,D-transpeptidase [Candidatus Nitrosocosmicus sp.]|nr:L,D-transpeptidase [Candidatus Nitrosocosmicus sp.]